MKDERVQVSEIRRQVDQRAFLISLQHCHLISEIHRGRRDMISAKNHALLADEPAWAKFVGEMEAFLSDGS